MNKSSKKSLGAALVEFALVGGIYCALIFCIYEIGLMLSIRNGLVAGMFYAARNGTTSGPVASDAQNIFATKFNGLAFNTFTPSNLTFTIYSSMANRNNNIGGTPSSTLGGAGDVLIYSANSTYTFLTKFMNNNATQKILTFDMTVINELG